MILQIHIDKLNLSPEILQEVLALQNLPETDFHACIQKIFDDAQKYRSFQRRRHERANERALRWGMEYHIYLQNHLAAGLRLKTAKSAARRDFIAAHPRPKMPMTSFGQMNFPVFPIHHSSTTIKLIWSLAYVPIAFP